MTYVKPSLPSPYLSLNPSYVWFYATQTQVSDWVHVTTFHVSPIHCNSCVRTIQSHFSDATAFPAASALSGPVSVDVSSGKTQFRYVSNGAPHWVEPAVLQSELEALGKEVSGYYVCCVVVFVCRTSFWFGVENEKWVLVANDRSSRGASPFPAPPTPPPPPPPAKTNRPLPPPPPLTLRCPPPTQRCNRWSLTPNRRLPNRRRHATHNTRARLQMM
jgi:hypothetical protein